MPRGYINSLNKLAELDVEYLEAIDEVLGHFTDGRSVINLVRLIKLDKVRINADQPSDSP